MQCNRDTHADRKFVPIRVIIILYSTVYMGPYWMRQYAHFRNGGGAKERQMNPSEFLRWQWRGYLRFHRSRFNLLLQMVAVPLFLAGTVALLAGLVPRSWLGAILAVAAMAFSVALQGRGHVARTMERLTGATGLQRAGTKEHFAALGRPPRQPNVPHG